MIKSLISKTAVLVLLFMVFSSGVYASPSFPNFRLRMEDGVGNGVVLTDNEEGDSEAAEGKIGFFGLFGNLNLLITLAWSQPEDDQTGQTFLRLDSQIFSFAPEQGQAAIPQLIITLEDTGYVFPGASATLTGSVSDVTMNTMADPILGGGVLNASFQTWLNKDNVAPNFGDVDVPTYGALDPVDLLVPVGSAALFAGSGPNGGVQVASSTPGPVEADGMFFTDNPPFPGNPKPFSLFSQAVVNFDPQLAGDIHFLLEAKVDVDRGTAPPLFPSTVPEPTSLLLLGSGLVALGLFGKKRSAT